MGLVEFGWLVKGVIAGCAKPITEKDFTDLYDEGIRSIVSLTENPLKTSFLETHAFDSLHLGIQDRCAPTQDQIPKFLEFVETMKHRQRPVVVHCWAGRGRTGCMLAVYLVAQGFTGNQAIEHVRSIRPRSIDTDEQLSAIEEFHRWMVSGKIKANGSSPKKK